MAATPIEITGKIKTMAIKWDTVDLNLTDCCVPKNQLERLTRQVNEDAVMVITITPVQSELPFEDKSGE